mgnify:CR=1 FL=1
MFEQRSCVKMKPCKIIVGLRTPQYERRLIVSAATIAGIQEIHELYINLLQCPHRKALAKVLGQTAG